MWNKVTSALLIRSQFRGQCFTVSYYIMYLNKLNILHLNIT